MTFSFVVPTLNSGAGLRRTIDSILAQRELPEFEVIVVDNGSTDDSIRSVEGLPHIRVVRETTRGASSARNTGFRESKGRFVAFVDADVVFSPDWATECMRDLAKPWVDGVQSRSEPSGREGSYMLRFRRAYIAAKTDGEFSYLGHAVKALPIANSSAIVVRREIIERGCAFEPGLERCEDLDFSLQLFARGCNFKLIDKKLVSVTDDRSMKAYTLRSFWNGYFTEVVRGLWRFERTGGAANWTWISKADDPAVAVGIFANQLAFLLGLFVGRTGRFVASVRREIVDDPRQFGVGSEVLSSRARMTFLPRETVIFELERGSKIVLNETQTRVLLNLLEGDEAGSQSARELLKQMRTGGFLRCSES